MTLVVKISGSSAVDAEKSIQNIAELVDDGEEVVAVHGGSSEVDNVLEKMGMEPEYVESPGGMKSRFTDGETMEVFSMVLAGKLNTEFTAQLRREGADAVGLSGVDGGLIEGPRKSAVKVLEDGRKKIRRGDHSGKVEEVNRELLEMLLEKGYTPVVTVPMLGDGKPVNADADRVAAAISGELEAELVLLTDVKGVMREPGREDSLIREVENSREMEEVEDVSEGFMSKKVMAVKEALERGAREAVIATSNTGKPVEKALEGEGTVFSPGALEVEK